MSRTRDDPKGIAGIAEPFRQHLAAPLVADVRLPVGRIRCAAGHHDLDSAPAVLLVMPARTQTGQLAVEVDADAAAHADDHRLAVDGLEAAVEMRHDVPGDEPEPRSGAGDGLELGPLGLELLLALDFLALGDLLEVGIDLRPLGLVQRQLREPALVVDRYGGAVLDGSLNVVDADVIAEHRARVGVLQLDRRAGETDERGIGERIAHVAGVAIDEVVLAAVRLIGDHHDVPAPRQLGMPVALLFRKELLDRGEHHAARLDRQLGAQVDTAAGLGRRLPQQVPAARERAEQLIVEVVPVRQHDDRWVFHRGLADDPPGVEGHSQALARALSVPDDADPPVAGTAARLSAGLVPAARLGDPPRLLPQCRRAQSFLHRRLYRVELVISGHLLGQLPAPIVLKHDEVPDQRQEPASLAHPLKHHLQLGQVAFSQRLARDRTPGLEPFPPCGERADPRVDSVRSDERRVEGEQTRELCLVSLDLLPRRPHRGLLIRRVLEFDQTQRKTIDEQHDIRPPLVLALDDGELVYRQPIVVRGVLVVEDGDLGSPHGAPGGPVLDRHAVHQHAVERAVAGFQRGAFRPGQLSECVVQGVAGEGRIQPLQRIAQPTLQNDLAIVASLGSGCVGANVGSVRDAPAEVREPIERRVLDGGFRDGAHPADSTSRLTIRRTIRSLSAGALSAISRVSAVSACGLSPCSIPSCAA